MVIDEGPATSVWSPVRIAGFVAVTLVIGVALVVAGRALLRGDDDPDAGLAEQAVFRRLVVIPDDAVVLIEPAWAATYYGSLLVLPNQADGLLADGELVERNAGVPNAPVFSYVQYTIQGDWTCLAYADFHDSGHPSPLVAVEQLDPDERVAFESGERLLANVGAICGKEEQFPTR